jgi:hypothetical protein
MAPPQIFGSTLISELDTRLGGLANAFETDEKFDFINSGIGAVWAVLKSLGQDYFVDDTQATTSTDDDYFAALNTTTREYSLPTKVREIRLIECTTSGYEHLKFEQRGMSDPDFVTARNYGTAQGAGSGTPLTRIYYYAVLGRRTIMFAQYPEVALTIKIWAVAALDDIDEATDELTEIMHPFWRGIVDYAAKLANLSVQNLAMDYAWRQQWQETVKQVVMSAAPRASTNAVFIQDFYGD